MTDVLMQTTEGRKSRNTVPLMKTFNLMTSFDEIDSPFFCKLCCVYTSMKITNLTSGIPSNKRSAAGLQAVMTN
jgi:hypothetical protein